MPTTRSRGDPFHIVFPLENGMKVRAQAAVCHKCGTTEFIHDNGVKKLPQDVIASKLRQKGWSVGARRSSDACPECRPRKGRPRKEASPRHARDVPATPAAPIPGEVWDVRDEATTSIMEEDDMTKNPPVLKVVPDAPASAVGAIVPDSPRQSTPADNRRIMDEMIDAYDTDNGRYFGNRSDHSVAVRLDVPRAWVTAVREQFFGPDRCEEDDHRARALSALDKKIESAMDDALTLAQRFESLRAEVRALTSKK